MDILSGRRIAVPESRELDLFVAMLERAGAEAIRCPLVSILDREDQEPVLAWLRRLIAGSHQDVVFYTGEGVRRLLAAAGRAGIRDDMVAALKAPRKIVRGPKPARALREIGLGPDLAADAPTTEGLVALLEPLGLGGRSVGVQLYPDYNTGLLEALERIGALVDPVLPYRYASDGEDARVVDLLHRMAAGEVDVIALTSRPQVKRLVDVARNRGLSDLLRRAGERTLVAAVGPVAAEAAEKAGWRVASVPESNFHLKPFIAAIAASLRDVAPAREPAAAT